jgi:uncharacterized small protein (DUF1192 family)
VSKLRAKPRAMAIADERSKENAVLRAEIKRLRAELESDVRYAQTAMKKV